MYAFVTVYREILTITLNKIQASTQRLDHNSYTVVCNLRICGQLTVTFTAFAGIVTKAGLGGLTKFFLDIYSLPPPPHRLIVVPLSFLLNQSSLGKYRAKTNNCSCGSMYMCYRTIRRGRR
jgi:hypothetical protein